jgi:hypothetical protein
MLVRQTGDSGLDLSRRPKRLVLAVLWALLVFLAAVAVLRELL